MDVGVRTSNSSNIPTNVIALFLIHYITLLLFEKNIGYWFYDIIYIDPLIAFTIIYQKLLSESSLNIRSLLDSLKKKKSLVILYIINYYIIENNYYLLTKIIYNKN